MAGSVVMRGRGMWFYGALVIGWLCLVAWQWTEHDRAAARYRGALLGHVQDLTTTLGIVVRSQARWVVPRQQQLTAALRALVENSELESVALLDPAHHVVASAGSLSAKDLKDVQGGMLRWEDGCLTVSHFLALGSGPRADEDAPPRSPRAGPDGRGQPPSRRPPGGPRGAFDDLREGRRRFARIQHMRRSLEWFRELGDRDFRRLHESQGMHLTVLRVPASNVENAIAGDRRVRVLVGTVAGAAAVLMALAWYKVQQTAELNVRLARDEVTIAHLRDMNLAAAGLAHETKNPLNVVRGAAQLIRRDAALPAGVRDRADAIVAEVDRVTGRLSEFMEYARPMELVLQPVSPGELVDDVCRILEADCREQGLTVTTDIPETRIEADEERLRQILFNLLLNAVQALKTSGTIRVSYEARRGAPGTLYVDDDGPGVPHDRWDDIFRAYVTYADSGTGLGLALVRQIALAHGWQIRCQTSPLGGARFALSGIRSAEQTTSRLGLTRRGTTTAQGPPGRT